MKTVWIYALLIVVTAIQITVGKSGTGKCDVCSVLVKGFEEGVKRTAKQHFAGGNTAWETEKLGKYARSETRLLEILEKVCKKGEDGDLDRETEHRCHHMVEENEEHIENWYFHKQTANPSLHLWLCIQTLKLCCPPNLYGPDCSPCPGPADRPCFGNGYCEGNGTRDGSGLCKCNEGYVGKLCRKCSSNFYALEENSTHITCLSCDRSCKGGCSGSTPDKCADCRTGWKMEPDVGCTDVDECSSNNPCSGAHEYCSNTVGSFECLCQTGYKKEKGQCVPDIAESTKADDDEEEDEDDKDEDPVSHATAATEPTSSSASSSAGAGMESQREEL